MAEWPAGFGLRRATPADHGALKDVCLKTGDSGGDGTRLQDDPNILGLVYTVPYQVFAPEFAYVLEDGAGVCGYVLGVPDTEAFDDWLHADWYPSLRTGRRDPGPDPARWQQSDWVRRRLFAPRAPTPVDLGRFPAHGHIDLLERARGRGIGRLMMERLMADLAQAGAPGLFLEVSHQNFPAQAFYRRLGFQVLADGADALFMGKDLGPSPQR